MKRARSHRLALPASIAAGAVLLAGALGFDAPDLVLYNHSPSVPQGLYLRVGEAPARGRFVTVRARDVARPLARERGFSENGDRFIKRVAAMSGDLVCAEADRLSINGREAARRLAHDSTGRPLEAWSGCRRLDDDEVLLLGDTDDSFDGRYWGPVSLRLVEGVWRPLR